MAEERQRAEEQKTKELARQIQQEREEQELENLTGKKKRDKGIDWMYQGGNPQSEIAQEDAKKKAEEYLLGKEYVPAGPVRGDLDAENTHEGVHAVLAQAEQHTVVEDHDRKPPASSFEPSVQDRNEAFRVRLEDPMFAVSRKAEEIKERAEHTKALYERVVGGIAVPAVDHETRDRDHDTEERHSRKKRSKPEKSQRQRKRHKKHRDSDDESDIDRRKYRRRRRSLSRSSSSSSESMASNHRRREKKEVALSTSKIETEHRHRSRNRDGSRSPGFKRDNSVDSKDSYADKMRHKRRYSDHRRSRDWYHRNHEGSRTSDDAKFSSERDRRPDERSAVDANRDNKAETRNIASARRYGLQGKSMPVGKGDLGPDKALLEKKRRERDEEIRRMRAMTSSRQFRTEEERLHALRAMEADARNREQNRSYLTTIQGSSRDNDAPTRRTAAFLQDVRKAAHGVDGNSRSMAERLQESRGAIQKPVDDSFL